MPEVAPEQAARRVRPTRPTPIRPNVGANVGWQSPPLPVESISTPCPHMGRMAAVLQTSQYALGTEWICTCGQVFVVAINMGGKRTLLKPEDVPAPELPLPEEDEPEAGVETQATPPPATPPKSGTVADRGGSTRA